MIHFVNYNLKCWICGNEADSREHKHKKTDVNRAFKNVPTNDKYIGVFKSGEIERHVQGVDSKLLKFEKVICQRCNNQSSQPHDFAYEKFVAYILNNFDNIVNQKGRILLSEVFPTNTSTNQRNLFKYFIKQFGCRLAQSGISISNSIIDYYFDWKKELNHFYVRFELDYDLLIALKKMKDENLGCGNFYYAPLNYLKPHKDSDDIDLVFSFYNNEWIRTRFFYSEKINTSDINWLNTYFEGDYLFFKIVSSFAPNEVENLSFDEFADKLKYAGLMKAKQPLIDKINEWLTKPFD